MKNIYKNGQAMKNSYSESELWIAVEDATNEIIRQLGENNMLDVPMNKKMVMLREALKPVMKTWNNHFQTYVPMNMESFALRGEDKKTCEAAFEQALIDYKKSRSAGLKTNVAAREWFNALRKLSPNISKQSILDYISSTLKQVWNAQVAANAISGKPYQEILYLKSTYLGNGKSTLMNALKEGALANGLEASAADWPEYNYPRTLPFMTNHMTFIDDSMKRDRDVDFEQLGAIGRRSKVTSKEKYQKAVEGNAQGMIVAAGNRDPYNKGDRVWRTIDVMPIDIKTIAAVTAADMSADTAKVIYNIKLQDFISLSAKIEKLFNEKNYRINFQNADKISDSDTLIAIQKEIGDHYIALIQAAAPNIDLKRFTVKKLVDYFRNTDNAIYPQSAASLANSLNKLYKNKLITRSSRSGDPTKSVYDLSFMLTANFEELDILPDSDLDIIMQAQAEWDRLEKLLFEEFDPEPTKSTEGNTDVDINKGTDRACLHKSDFGESNCTKSQVKDNIELGDTGTKEQLEEDKMNLNVLNIMNKLSEDIEQPPIKDPNDLPKDKLIKVEYTFDDGTTMTSIRTTEEFCQNELNLLEDNVRPFAKTMIERGYLKQCKPNPIGAKTIRMTYIDEVPTNALPKKPEINIKEYLKLNEHTDARTPEEIEWDNLLKKNL